MFYLVYGFIYFLSLLPMQVLYLLGDGIRFILFGIIGYRKRVIMDNLRHSFPEKSEPELEAIARSFFRHFTDTWMEAIKFFSISKKNIGKMVEFDNRIFEELFAGSKSCQLMSGHFMNWELVPLVLPAFQSLLLVGVYMPISSAAMNKVFIKLRSRFGTVLIPANDVKNGLKAYEHIPHIFALGADQSPSKPGKAFWMYFLNQRTAFPTGPAKNACRTNVPVVFSWMEKLKRGRYKLHVEMMSDNPASIGEEGITLLYAQKLQQIIQQHPDNYLWSHRRWKHGWKDEYAANWIDVQPIQSVA